MGLIERVQKAAAMGKATPLESDDHMLLEERVTLLFYLIARDHLPVGAIEKIITNHVENSAGKKIVFSSARLESMARDWTRRLLADLK